MRTDAILRRFGWRQSKGKWVTEGHSKPLTTEQAKNAFARDLKAKDFSALKKSGRLDAAQKAIDEGYAYKKGGFKKAGQKKARTVQDIQNERAKQKLRERAVRSRELGFRSDAERKKVSDWTKNNLEAYEHFVNQYRETQGEITSETGALVARLLYDYKNSSGKKSQQALNDLLLLVGFRSGNEPYPAGQTPRRKK